MRMEQNQEATRERLPSYMQNKRAVMPCEEQSFLTVQTKVVRSADLDFACLRAARAARS